ncbi:MBL fold metallo-hydrolase [Actinotalea ferrariae]|uniref:MBL fold metallo-hydrolase n=1 Tax=Actinotalea ferrariae TaxID=1386098 RepID=UPI001C8C6373|nr:MBL fold metallo-hydrolase [Actinotalea ferrariae]MBX9243400.1 MBL fold metallo-hydrolase [Actinotalea ferrariae]
MDPLGWLLVVGGVLALLVVADRVVARLPPRPRRPDDAPGVRPGGGSGMFGELVEILQPSARHLHEEQERQRHDLVLPGDADPPWTVDLDAGTAVVPGAVPHAGHGVRQDGGQDGGQDARQDAGDAGEHAGQDAAPDGGRETVPGSPRGPRELATSAPHLIQLAPGVWVTTSQPWSTTTTVVAGPGGRCLVVDPALTPADLDALAAELAGRGWSVEAGFSTHPHWDHVLWSTRLGDVPRWATPDAVARAARTHAELVAEAGRTAPGHDAALLGRLDPLDGEEVPWSGPRAVVVPHRAHCPGSAAVVIPDAGVLLAGDLLSDQEIPLLDVDSPDPVADHLAALDALEAAAARWAVEVLVPGHGTPTDAAGLAEQLAADRAYLEALRAAVGGTAAGSSVDDVVDDVVDRRLVDPEQRDHHAHQLAALRRRGGVRDPS